MEIILDQGAGQEKSHKSLQDLSNGDYKVDLSKYINQAFEIFKQEWALFGAYTFVMILLVALSVITIIGPLLIALPLTAGYHIACKKIKAGEALAFSDFFGGFSKFSDFAVLMLVQIAIIIVPSLMIGLFPLLGEMAGDAGIVFVLIGGVLQLLFYVVMVAFTALTYFCVPLILFGDLTATQALKYSFRIAKHQFWWIILISLLAGIFAQIGVIACFVGVFFTASFTEIFRFLTYDDVFGLASRSSEAE
jgi:hypothetical protein